ncbi:MAG TPA: glycosyl hydrolase 115 family protein [Cyclobacteriaceae bacterium]|nr:glycosyl hydrolase 115 family protein [Cyclobacteriaceae bacterium]
MVLLIYCHFSVAQVFMKDPKAFALADDGKLAPLCMNSSDFQGVIRALNDLKNDIKSVTDQAPLLFMNKFPEAQEIVIVGTIGKSALIDQLIQNKKINIEDIKGKWETSLTQVVKNPFPNVKQALVIAGSDKRGTIYGIYELSKQIGVSPWYWWADVPPKKNTSLFMPAGRFVAGPAVKYRGIFINDEAPALAGWATEKFGGFNHQFYEKVYELILRLKGNYLWPAMWGRAIYDDDSLSATLANEYGVVIGTSHHEPLMRAHVEWSRYGSGDWNYETNEAKLKEFWTKGIERMGTNESIISLAMRGDGDKAMTQNTNIELLERIVKDQRDIISKVTGKEITQVPQLWALYKEVQDYYDKGMRVPDDVTLLLCDDNWGNIRKLPKPTDPKRSGGYGIYYHFDYVGGPRNYKWLNTNPIPRVWEQMHLAYEHGVDRIWIVNVGDIKPMEFPISFFLDYAWNPKAIQADQLQAYTEHWCEQQFGKANAKEIAGLISLYLKYSGRIKPELLNETTYSLNNYNEFERVIKDYRALDSLASVVAKKIDPSGQEAFYQLVWHPILASSNLHELYYYVALNKQAVSKNDSRANHYAAEAIKHYKKDSLITVDFHQRNNGKWNHMMSQTHIGYTYWQQPPVNKMPTVTSILGREDVKDEPSPPSRDAANLIKEKSNKNIFFERDQYVSIEAHHTTSVSNTNNIKWTVLPDLGKTGSAVTPFPVTAPAQMLSASSPHIEYEFYSYSQGNATLQLFFSPTLNFHNTKTGLQYAISIDNETPQVIGLNAEDAQVKIWGKWVADNVIVKTSNHTISKPGKHTIKFWMINPGVVLQKLVLDFGGVKPSYLGPPETKYKTSK